MRWRLILEEFGPTLEYVPGEKNVVADALSRLELTEEQLDAFQYAEVFGVRKNDIPDDIYPLNYKQVDRSGTEARQDSALSPTKR